MVTKKAKLQHEQRMTPSITKPSMLVRQSTICVAFAEWIKNIQFSATHNGSHLEHTSSAHDQIFHLWVMTNESSWDLSSVFFNIVVETKPTWNSFQLQTDSQEDICLRNKRQYPNLGTKWSCWTAFSRPRWRCYHDWSCSKSRPDGNWHQCTRQTLSPSHSSLVHFAHSNCRSVPQFTPTLFMAVCKKHISTV